MAESGPIVARDPQWYRDAIIYEAHVRAFRDSNGDGIGDFAGLTSRLDYIQQLGVTAIWLLPFYPSPLRDDGYDIANYMDVHPSYGTLSDFRTFLDEAHRRSMRVITELVINHTSDQHPWFQRARRAAPGTTEREFYVWNDTPDRYSEVRIIFQDTETSNWAWDPVAGAYYWHRFFSHQPDLNYDNPAVMESVLEAMDFWLDMGVDGLRLDAIPYLYERDGTNGENLPETHEALKTIRAHVDAHYENRMLLAEANQWPEDSAEYFGKGDECHMAFHFPVMPRLYLALHSGTRLPIVDILEQTPPIPEESQWATFLRNHDELTLEMVTEEERETLWDAYAPDRRARLNLGIRRRLAPLLGKDRRRLELMFGLLLSLPGTPVLYYGDEIGMGDNIFLEDRDGVRTPMQWNNNRNAGFSDANPQSLYLPLIIDPDYHYETVNVEAQHANPNSLLWWVRGMLRMRRRHPVFGRGDLTMLDPDNPHVLAFIRSLDDEHILVVANLSRDAQYVKLDLDGYEGRSPMELVGTTRFPDVGEDPYLLTMSPYSFFWFELLDPKEPEDLHGPIELADGIDTLVGSEHPLILAIRSYLDQERWFPALAGDGPLVLRDLIPVGPPDGVSGRWLAIMDRAGRSGQSATLALPIGVQLDGAETPVAEERRIAEVSWSGHEGVLYDATTDEDFSDLLLEECCTADGVTSQRGRLTFARPAADAGSESRPTVVRPLRVSDRNGSTVIDVDDDRQLRLFRILEPGTAPGVELRTYLAERDAGRFITPLEGWLRYDSDESFTVGVIERRAPDATSAWDLFHGLAVRHLEGDDDALDEAIGLVGHLAKVVGEIHTVLGEHSEDPAMRPEPMTTLVQRGMYQSLRSSIRESLASVRAHVSRLKPPVAGHVREVLRRSDEILKRLELLRARPLQALRTRVHGDLRLDVFSWDGEEFHIDDFAGDRSLRHSQRRLKHVALRDLAQLLRSLDYAAMRADVAAGNRDPVAGSVRAEEWSNRVREAMLEAGLEALAGTPLLPDDPEDVELLLHLYRLTRVASELRWEVANRPEWIPVALRGIYREMGWSPD